MKKIIYILGAVLVAIIGIVAMLRIALTSDYRGVVAGLEASEGIKAYWFDYYEGRALNLHIWTNDGRYLKFWSIKSENFQKLYPGSLVQLDDLRVFCTWDSRKQNGEPPSKGIQFLALNDLAPTEKPMTVPLIVKEHVAIATLVNSLVDNEMDAVPFPEGSYPTRLFRPDEAGKQINLRCWANKAEIPAIRPDAVFPGST